MSTKCRRCGECIGCEHHWIEELTYARYDADGDPFEDEPPIADRACKHCDVIGNECEDCDGFGVTDDEDDDGDSDPICPTCGGRGVNIVNGDAT